MLVPVYQELKEEFDITFLGLSIAGQVLKRMGIPYKSFSDYENIIFDHRASLYGQELADLWHVDGKVPRRESEIYLGCCMRDLVYEHGEKNARAMIVESGRQIFVPMVTAQKIIEQETPDLILTTNSPRTELALTLAGKKLGISTVNIHDHLAFEPRHMLTADQILVMCEITKENLVKTGHDPQKIFITGQPAFDAILSELETYDRRTICAKLGLKPEKKYILLGSQKQFKTEMLICIIRSIENSFPEFQLIIKPHPGEDYSKYEKLKRHYPNFYLLTDIPIRELIYISEVMIALWSTVALEAVLMGKPLIQFNLPELSNLVPLFQFGVAIESKSLNDLSKHLKTVLFDLGFRVKANKNKEKIFSCLLSGRSTESVANHIRDMLS